ncbi:MAG: hypothetical protein HQ534_12655 [Armatimonadetes bacterium]|nr:hypothetical protein [Armatimonadota bacterium]
MQLTGVSVESHSIHGTLAAIIKIEDKMKKITLTSINNSLYEIDEKYTESYQGRLLSHYTNMNSLISIISTGYFWASNSMFLNDKSEIIHLKKVIEKNIKRYFPKEDISEFTKWVMKHFDHVSDKVSKNTFIVSFSTEQDSLPLWSNYSFNYGCSINLSYNDILSNININTPPLLSNNIRNKKIDKIFIDSGLVIYDNSTKSKIINEYLKILYSLLKKIPLKSIEEIKSNEWIIPIIKRIFTRLFMIASLTKENYFESESEFRFICNVDVESQSSLLNFRESNGLIIPYIKMNSLFRNIKLPIISITLGPRNNAEKAKVGLKKFLNSKGYTNFEILQSKIPLRY